MGIKSAKWIIDSNPLIVIATGLFGDRARKAVEIGALEPYCAKKRGRKAPQIITEGEKVFLKIAGKTIIVVPAEILPYGKAGQYIVSADLIGDTKMYEKLRSALGRPIEIVERKIPEPRFSYGGAWLFPG